ncbi:hypothetical protein Trco_002513 [Trichoderma cornu-damae]|uniref:F-box domain-containing protein n=1 Tax=Trichoderma cornu-damae TaxID=654480 RepID=A0A9P8QV15_9HYPO|nr:hypothetical protein Trco_002513 [Trichoderma cornu-damae]
MATTVSRLFRLPNEVLLHIFTIAASDSEFMSGRRVNDRRTCIALSRTCRRFHSIATLVLYRDLNMCASRYNWNSLLLRRATRCLHRTLKEKPELRKHCSLLSIDLGYSTNSAVLVPYLMDLAVWLTHTKTLRIDGRFKGGEEELLLSKAAVQHMPMLEGVSLLNGLDLRQVYETVSCLSHLRVLELSGTSAPHDPLLWNAFEEGTSPITSLIIRGFRDSPGILRHLVAWPAKLEHFSFTECDDEASRVWGLPIIACIIAPHRATLRSITVSSLPEKGLADFDLTGFENLKHLSLSSWVTGFAEGDETNLLAPRLTSFRWVFTLEQQHSESLLDFGEVQEHWLRRFIAEAIARGLPLRDIDIRYAPDRFYLPTDLPEIYPWDRMESIERDFQDKGIKLSWTFPTISREHYREVSKPQEEGEDMDMWFTDGDEEGDEENGSDVSEGSEGGYGYFPFQSNTLMNYCRRNEDGTMPLKETRPTFIQLTYPTIYAGS